jgi:N6-L-threonylcarbamoyladenine synthase
MQILGIETSCDETAAAVVADGTSVLSNVVSSQVKLHAGFGGVVPELAAREHLKNLGPVVDEALSHAGVAISDIAGLAVTCRPGLVPALVVGASYAKGAAAAAGVPLVGINHFFGHVYSAFLDNPELLADAGAFPVLALVVSGGHTSLIMIAADGQASMVGTTLDDAAGEAFDKAAKILELGYPGGPIIDRLAAEGDPAAVDFPRGLTGGSGKPVADEHRYNFSFSGVKTALLYKVQDRDVGKSELVNLVASYQAAIVDVLVGKTMAAAQEHKARTLVVCGGVACNSRLRAEMTTAAEGTGVRLLVAPPKYCTDNAVMIAGLAWHYLKHGLASGLDLAIAARLETAFAPLPFAPLYRP